MTSFILSGTFPPSGGLPSSTLSGTLSLDGGPTDITSSVLSTHFTFVESTVSFPGPGFFFTRIHDQANDEIDLTFQPFNSLGAVLTLTDMTQAKVVNGVLYNQTGGTHFFGISFGGTLCPDSGCVPFIVPVQTPAPVTGSGIVGLLLLVTLLLGKVRAVVFSAGG
jgi:hypothetical protein